MDSYTTISRFYDLENAGFTEDLPLWAELARAQGGPVLELGCGSGRVLLHLAREGCAVTGVDSSPAMLALARSRLARQSSIAGRVTLREEDFTRIRLGKTFPLILLPFNTFAHMIDPAEVRAALETVFQHLPSGGRAALALPNPIPIYGDPPESLVLERTFRDEARGVAVQQFSSLRVDRAAQLGHITWIYDEIDPSGTVTRTSIPMTLRYFFPNELAALFERAGLRLLHLWGDYDRSPFAEDSPVLIAVAGRE
ncbi:MAG: class I SAM-dependent methyltransferase [Anaerolineales bacterium]|nr:class I SAM-dependent methyltransferase [Anaerolineales bacterium]